MGNRLSMGNSTSSVSDADIKSILDQVEQHQKELSTLTPIGAEKKPDGDGVNKNDVKLSGVSSQKTSVSDVLEEEKVSTETSKPTTTSSSVSLRNPPKDTNGVKANEDASKTSSDDKNKNNINGSVDKFSQNGINNKDNENNNINNAKNDNNSNSDNNNSNNSKNNDNKTKTNNTLTTNKPVKTGWRNKTENIFKTKNKEDNDAKNKNNNTTDKKASTISGTNNINIKLNSTKRNSTSEKVSKFQEATQKKVPDVPQKKTPDVPAKKTEGFRREGSGAQLRKEAKIDQTPVQPTTTTTTKTPTEPTASDLPDSPPQESKTATQTKLEEIAARREALRKKYLARSHTESSIAIERKERFQRQGFNEGKGSLGDDSDDIPEPQSAGELLNLIVNRENSFVHRDSGSSGGEEKKKKKLMLKGSGGGETPPVVRK